MNTIETLKAWADREGMTKVAAACEVDVRTLYRWFESGQGPAQARTRRMVETVTASAAERLGIKTPATV